MKPLKVFISYSRADGKWVTEFAEALLARGLEPWLDIWSIRVGEGIVDQMELALRSSDAIVSVVPSDGRLSPNALFEMGAAIGMRKPFIPIIAADVPIKSLPVDVAKALSVIRSDPAETASIVTSALAHQVRRETEFLSAAASPVAA